MKFIHDRNKILSVELPVETIHYKPVSHSSVVQSILEFCDRKSVPIISESYLANRTGSQVIGKYVLGLSKDGVNCQIAFKNSYDKSMSVGFAAGAEIFICSNGCVRGEISYKKKHVGNVVQELNDNILSTYELLEEELTAVVADLSHFKEIEVRPHQLHETIGRMYLEEDILNTEQMQVIKHEMDHSEHFKGRTAYDVYNWANHALKSSHPINYLQKHIDLHRLFTSLF